MSFLAKLSLGSAEFNVLAADYEIHQPTDSQNRPNGKPKGGLINLTLEASNKNDLAEWMLSPTMKKTGQLTFYRRDANSSMKTVAFSDAFCINYKEVFDASSNEPMKTLIRISAGELKINNTSVTNAWSSMAARAKDIADKIGLSSIMGGSDGPGGMMDDLMSNPAVAQTVAAASDAYSTGKKGYDEAQAAKKDAEVMKKDAEQQAKKAEDAGHDAQDEITSFIP